MRRLWAEARPIHASAAPSWLAPGEQMLYRHLGTFTDAGLAPLGRPTYLSELEAMRAAGIIVDQTADRPEDHDLYVAAPTDWAIAIYHGQWPCNFSPLPGLQVPVLTRNDIIDVQADFVADPFLLPVDGQWFMFFEVMNWQTHKGEIGLARSADGRQWRYEQIVLSEPFHLSYPYVFEWNGDYYMIPESHQAGAVRLYRAERFPYDWSAVADLLSMPYAVDASIFRHLGYWWLLVETNSELKHDTLRLYSAASLTGPWSEHPCSPVVQGDPTAARPAGRVRVESGRIVRYAQSCLPAYGTDVRAFAVTDLTLTTYREQPLDPVPFLGPGSTAWNASGMHHIDPHPDGAGHWIASVDGYSTG